jgi:endonuclease-3
MLGDVQVEIPGASAGGLRSRWSSGGTYTLVVNVPSPTTLSVGALGTQELPAGGYAYTGSALGTGGFSRVERHHRLATGDHEARHWHVDYLLGHPETTLRAAVFALDVDLECEIAAALGDGPVDGFGSSDCSCRSHLSRRPTVDAMKAATLTAYGSQSRENVR